MNQFQLTPAAGKRLIGKALVRDPAVKAALEDGTLVIIAGTTNGYVAEEILSSLGRLEGFSRRRFFRGVTTPPRLPTTDSGRLPDESEFPGDVVLRQGQWLKGKTIFDVVNDLRAGDVILKGANALDMARGQAAILIGDARAGTTGAALQAAAGRRVELILPVGLEKRVGGDLLGLAARVNAPESRGYRLLPVPGRAFTELHAIALWSGAQAELVAAGGVGGAEGCIWLGVSGTEEQLRAADALIRSVEAEPPFAW
jgi:hypothetical protein